MHTAPSWTFGPFELDVRTFRLRRDTRVVPLEPKAVDLLRLLLERAPAVVEKSEIFDHVWRDVAVTDNALTRVVAQLRRALDDDARAPRYIETVATRGYRFIADLTPAADCADIALANATLSAETGARATTPSAVSAETATPAVAGAALAVEHVPQVAMAPRVDTTDADGAAAREFVRAVSSPTMRGVHGQRLRWGALMFAAVLAIAVVGVVALRPLVTRISKKDVMQSARLADNRLPLDNLAMARPAQVTTGAGLDGQPAFSHDGTTLAFSSDRSGSFEIYVQSLTPGAVPTALTANGRANIQPAWSPDGRFIAYHDAAGGGIWMVPSRGGTAKRLAERGSSPAWSPDGRLIAFQSLASNLIPASNPPNEPSSIWVVEPETGRSRAVTETSALGRPQVAPRWSPDGRRLFFVETPAPTAPGGTTLWSVDIATGDRRMEAQSRMMLPDYAVAPDGSGAWTLTRTGMVWWLPLTGEVSARQPRPTGLPSPGMQSELTLSPDGHVLAWTLVQPRSELQSVALPGPDGRPASPTPVALGSGIRATGAVAAPDGRLAYSGTLQGSASQIWIRNVDGTVRQITLDGGDHGNPTWLPGYTEVAYFSGHGANGYSAVNVMTGVERALFNVSDLRLPAGTSMHPLAYLNVVIDRTASRVAFAAASHGVMNLWVSDLDHAGRPSAPRQLTAEHQGGAFPKWSADGRWISYQCDEGADTHVCVIGSDGTGRRQLTRDSGLNFTGGWIDSDTILVAARRSAVWNVIGVNRTTGAATACTGFTDGRSYVRYPQWDAVNRRITFERSETTGNVWMARLR